MLRELVTPIGRPLYMLLIRDHLWERIPQTIVSPLPFLECNYNQSSRLSSFPSLSPIIAPSSPSDKHFQLA